MAISEAIWWAYELLFNICATSQDPLPISLPVSCLCLYAIGFSADSDSVPLVADNFRSCQNDGWFTVYMYWHWHHCPSFLHDLLVSLPLIHSLSLPLLVFMLPYVFYNCFYETTHNIYRQKISWPTNEQLQHLSCRRLLTHTDTANSRAASITHGDLLLQTETIPPLPAVYFHIEPSPVSVTRHQPCVTIGPGVGSISRRGHEHARSSCAALCDQFDESSIFTTCKAFHEWNVIVSTARAGSQSCLFWEWCWLIVHSVQCSSLKL